MPCFPTTCSGKEGKRKLNARKDLSCGKMNFLWILQNNYPVFPSPWPNSPSWEEFWASCWVGCFFANSHLKPPAKKKGRFPVLRCKTSFNRFALTLIPTRDTRILHNQHSNSFVKTTEPQKGQGFCDTDSIFLKPALPLGPLSSLIPCKQQGMPV